MNGFWRVFACLLGYASVVLAGQASEVGLGGDGRILDAFVVEAARPGAYSVLLIGGLDGDGDSRLAVIEEGRKYDARKERLRPFRLSVIADIRLARDQAVFPPAGKAYREHPEAHALWRWIGIHAPDLVLIAGEDFGLAEALSNQAVAGIGRVAARRTGTKIQWEKWAGQLREHSEARKVQTDRQLRSPKEVAEALGRMYGRRFQQPTYLEGMALISRMKLGATDEVRRLSEPYLSGAADSLARATSLHLAGHLVFAELAARAGDRRALALAQRAADLGFDKGVMKESMPFHNEMSDSIFMGTAILAKVGKLTGEQRYFAMAARHLAFMNKLVRRPDGLYRHSPLTDAAWGRGNAFAIMGHALALSEWPADDPARAGVLADYQTLAAELVRFQTREGMWREVIDFTGSYGETSATAMIGFAIERGLRRGWLAPEFFRKRVDAAWDAVKARTGSDGVFLDVCESTNKQATLNDYLWREALAGTDDRAGGMVMLFATELAGLE